MSDLKDLIEAATKDAMRARDRDRVKALRLVNAELKQAAIDGRKTLADADVVSVLARMRKQRRDSLGQFETAGREDLAAIERFEIDVIEEFLPQALSADEIEQAVAAAIKATGATGMRDMGKVMGALKGELTGRADMGAVSQIVRAALQA
ncbi:MAG: GatB/YqeY domain-containing protein [Gammaproteobacteria bacterium]|nr:GatB/YqeY domain-containing protein [Gammaproteobacteria bacterium]MXY58171.1 GatB/YqeY domain-containing protein [Gammaproteobacteria bacterium]MYF31116.1 GatB/YqeY domain-containing protein [Gammaproteobacteria bacterium]MYK45393.1 GatB/YqeY domain-containing protein [Gammaproteobacteria bacterium]